MIEKIVIIIIFLAISYKLIVNNKNTSYYMLKSGMKIAVEDIENKLTKKQINQTRLFVYFCGSIFFLVALILFISILFDKISVFGI